MSRGEVEEVAARLAEALADLVVECRRGEDDTEAVRCFAGEDELRLSLDAMLQVGQAEGQTVNGRIQQLLPPLTSDDERVPAGYALRGADREVGQLRRHVRAQVAGRADEAPDLGETER